MKMKYLLGRRGMEITFGEKEIPVPGYQEVLVRVSACGVCGSDLHLLQESREWTPLGHEFSGEVAAIGPGVTGLGMQDHVVVEDVTGCGRCINCKNGYPQLCTGKIGLNGQSGMGEYVCVHERMLNKYEGISAAAATLTEPLAVCINTYLTAGVPMEGNVVIFGLGPLAVMTAALARHYGAGDVVCVGSRQGTFRNQVREDAALAFGADAVLYMSAPGWEERLKGKMRGPIHSIIVTSPPGTLPAALKLADYGTKIVPIGLDMGCRSEAVIDVDRLIMNKNPILPFLAEPANKFPLSVEMLRRQVIDAQKLITHRIAFTDAAGLKELFEQDNGVIKAVLTIH